MIAIRLLMALASMAITPAFADVPSREFLPNGNSTPMDQNIKGVYLHAMTPVYAPENLAKEKTLLESILEQNCPDHPINGMLLPIGLQMSSEMAPKAYKLEIKVHEIPTTSGTMLVGISITGGSPAGVSYGIQRLKQIVIDYKSKGILRIPFMTIEDEQTEKLK